MEPMRPWQVERWVQMAKERLTPLGWEHVWRGRFRKNGVVYDLIAANLNILDRIEREGLFVVSE
jgi:hypothetical protein